MPRMCHSTSVSTAEACHSLYEILEALSSPVPGRHVRHHFSPVRAMECVGRSSSGVVVYPLFSLFRTCLVAIAAKAPAGDAGDAGARGGGAA